MLNARLVASYPSLHRGKQKQECAMPMSIDISWMTVVVVVMSAVSFVCIYITQPQAD
jgi:hypothetical protein